LVGRRNNHHRTPKTLFAEDFKELAHFPATFSHQRKNRHIRRCPAGHHADKRALSDATSTEDADSLTSATRHESIDGSYTAT
jgi:hypothetical protein